MSDVEISAENHWLVQLFEVFLEIDVPLFGPVIQSVEPYYSCVGYVCYDESEVFEMTRDCPSLLVMLAFFSKVVGNFK